MYSGTGWLAIYWFVDLLYLIFSLNKKDLTEACGLQLTKDCMANLEKEKKLSLCFMDFPSARKLQRLVKFSEAGGRQKM